MGKSSEQRTGFLVTWPAAFFVSLINFEKGEHGEGMTAYSSYNATIIGTHLCCGHSAKCQVNG